MFTYITKRLFYAIPILIGVNLITFMLFFMINTPDDMARSQLGAKQVTPQMIEAWKVDRGYDKLEQKLCNVGAKIIRGNEKYLNYFLLVLVFWVKYSVQF